MDWDCLHKNDSYFWKFDESSSFRMVNSICSLNFLPKLIASFMFFNERWRHVLVHLKKCDLKTQLAEIVVLILCEINDNTLGFGLILSGHIHNAVKQIIWSVLQKQSKAKCRQLFLEKAPSKMFHWVLNTSLFLISE